LLFSLNFVGIYYLFKEVKIWKRNLNNFIKKNICILAGWLARIVRFCSCE